MFGFATVQAPPVSGVWAVHVPVPGWHVPGVLHELLALQVTSLVPVQTPA
jgi:hypothetical protein